MEIQSFDCVWDAIEDTPEDAALMAMRSQLLITLTERVKGWRLTQAASAKRLNITLPRLNQLMRHGINNFELEELVRLTRTSGLTVKLSFREITQSKRINQTG